MSAERYLIGKSTLDVSLGCLRRNGADVSLRPKSFALLRFLVENVDRLVEAAIDGRGFRWKRRPEPCAPIAAKC